MRRRLEYSSLSMSMLICRANPSFKHLNGDVTASFSSVFLIVGPFSRFSLFRLSMNDVICVQIAKVP